MNLILDKAAARVIVAAIVAVVTGAGSLSASAGVTANPCAAPRLAAIPGRITGVGNFAQVSPVLYRGEQPTAEGFAALKALGIKTVIDLRSFHDDRHLIAGLGLRYARIRANAWHPEDEDLVRFLSIVENPANQPVFVHCMQGADRTGYAVAAYRMLEQGWDAGDALAEMQNFGRHWFWVDIPLYLKRLNSASLRAGINTGCSARTFVVN